MAVYFLAANQAKSNKTGNPFFTVSLLAVNSYGRWSGNDYFVTQKVFDSVVKQGLEPGFPVLVSFTGDGKLRRIKIDDEAEPLVLIPDADD